MASGGTEAGKSLNKLKGRIARGEGFTVVRLDGVIDEHNELASFTDKIGSGDSLLVDLGGIKRLNSVGVRDWVNWLRALRPKFVRIVLFDCPPPVMNEVNFVKNFAEGAHITTFAVPLFCARCNKEESRLIEVAPLRAGGKKLPSFVCEKAACENTIDDDEDSYLAFLDSLPESPDPARLMQLTSLARVAAQAAPPLEGGAVEPPPRPMPVGQSQRPAPAPTPVVERAESGRGDWLFMAAMAAMVAVLGVLVYLILTLE